MLRSLGQPTIRIDVDRVRAARYGLAPGDVNAVVQTAIGGQSAGRPLRGQQRSAFSDDGAAGRAVSAKPRCHPAHSHRGAGGHRQRRHSDPARRMWPTCDLVSGAAFIYREQQQRYVPIKFSVRGRDLGGAVLEAQHAVDAQVPLPGGYRLEWVGEFGNLQEAPSRASSVAVPLSLALIVLLLYLNFSSLRDALLAASVIPMALLGGILALWMTGTAVQRVLGHRLRGAVRHCGHGRHSDPVLLPFEPRVGTRSRQRHAANLPHPAAAGDDDLHRGLRGPAPGGVFHRHRLASATPAGAGRGGRHAAGAGPDSAGAAGADIEILPGAGIPPEEPREAAE